jgi:hypothetical protein
MERECAQSPNPTNTKLFFLLVLVCGAETKPPCERRIGARLSDYHRREQYHCPAPKSVWAYLVDLIWMC